MRRVAATIDALSRLHPETRLFVALTITEAAGLVGEGTHTAALQGLAKIRAALQGALTPAPIAPTPVVKQSGQIDETLISEQRAQLRAKDYHPEPRTPHFRMAKAAIRPKAPIGLPPETPAPSPELDDYVPWRDEADGIYT